MQKEKIRITSHWNVPPSTKYNIGDEYIAVLYPCSHTSNGECYAVLDNGYTIPNGCFEFVNPKRGDSKTKKAVFRKEFSQGYAAALLVLIVSNGVEPDIAEAWQANFGRKQTLKSLKQLGIDEYDISVIKPHLKELNK